MKGEMSKGTRAAVLTAAIAALVPAAGWAGAASSYLQSAHQLEKKGDFRGAEIQLRNAAQAEPANGAILIELAQVYLKIGNPNAAQAELFAAHLRGVREEVAAPLMAQALLEMGDDADLLKNVPAGNRPPKIESMVRTYRGMAELGLKEIDRARAMFADAERLDPKSTLALIGEARLLMAQHQLDAAGQKADQALKLDPKQGDALDVKALVFAMRGKLDQAMRTFAVALAADPRNIRVLLDRTSLEVDTGNVALALKDLKTIGTIAPGSVMALYLKAAIDARTGNDREADSLLDKLRGAMVGYTPAYLLAAEVKFKLNEVAQAESLANKFVAQAGDQPRGYQLLAAIAMKRGDLDRTIAMLEKAVKLAPGDANTLGRLGQAYIAHGDLDKAKVMFDQAAVHAPNNDAVRMGRAIAQFESGDRDASLAGLRDVFRDGKGNMLAGPPLVIEALQSGEAGQAEIAARALVAREPANTTYEELLAAAEMAQHDYAPAEAQLNALLAKQPNLGSARRDLALIYLATNRTGEAKKLFDMRLKANPKDVEALEVLADITARSKDDAGAVRLLEQAQAIVPTDPKPSLAIIAILEARKKWPEAIARAHALQTKFANDPGVEDTLAAVEFQSGDQAASLAEYKKAVAKFPRSAVLFAHQAGALAAKKDYAEAILAALRAVALEPRDGNLKRAAVALFYLAKGPDAARVESESLFKDSAAPAAVLVAADVIEGNNNRPAATAMLEQAQARSPSGAVVVRLAVAYSRDKRPDKAIALLESWTRTHGDEADPRFALAQLYGAAGKNDLALAQYEWLAAHRPEDLVVLNNLAWYYDQKHDPRARKIAQQAFRLAPTSGSIADTLGWIMMNQGDAAGAVKYLQQASTSMPNDGTIQYHYAVALSKTGRVDQARGILQKVLVAKTAPDTLAAAHALLASLGPAH